MHGLKPPQSIWRNFWGAFFPALFSESKVVFLETAAFLETKIEIWNCFFSTKIFIFTGQNVLAPLMIKGSSSAKNKFAQCVKQNFLASKWPVKILWLMSTAIFLLRTIWKPYRITRLSSLKFDDYLYIILEFWREKNIFKKRSSTI